MNELNEEKNHRMKHLMRLFNIHTKNMRPQKRYRRNSRGWLYISRFQGA